METIFTSQKRNYLLFLGLFLALFAGTHAQTTHKVEVSSNVFNPSELAIKVGDKVEWANVGGSHNVNGTTGTFSSNPESFGNNVGRGWTFSHTFSKSGIYNYQCDPHVSFGMTGKITVESSQTTSSADIETQNRITVYPNPFRSVLFIDIHNLQNENLDFSIYNSIGVLMKNRVVASNNGMVELELGDLKNGLYFLKAEGENISVVKKVLKR